MKYVVSLLVFLMISMPTYPGQSAITYTYDDYGRITRVAYGEDRVITYTYDSNSNILSRVVTRPCFDFQLLLDTAPQWSTDSVSVLDLIEIVNCPQT